MKRKALQHLIYSCKTSTRSWDNVFPLSAAKEQQQCDHQTFNERQLCETKFNSVYSICSGQFLFQVSFKDKNLSRVNKPWV